MSAAPFVLGWVNEDDMSASLDTGERARLERMVSAELPIVRRTLLRMGIPQDDLADCAQKVFLVASRRLSAIAAGSERSFLLGTAIRVCSDYRRTMRRRHEVPIEDTFDPPSLGPSPDELTDQRQLRALLDRILATMPEDLRAVFILFEIEEMKSPEIAALLGLPVGTVASRLRRAREAFDEQVTQLQKGEKR